MYGLLSGLRVVEGAAFVAGPSCGLYMAQLGAEVIRFDQIGGGPDFGRWPLSEGGASLYWEGLNRGKKSVALDMTRPAGRELALALAAAPGPDAGVFVTNFPEKSFLSYENLAARRPDIVSVRIMGWADGRPAVDYTVNAATGVPAMTGPASWPDPINHVLPAWDLLTGAYAGFALLAALRDRDRRGVGRELRIPLSDVAAASLSNLGQVAETLLSGKDRERMGNDLYGAFGRDFEVADGRVMIVAITPRQWAGLVAALGLEAEVAAVEARLGVSFATDEGARFRHRDQLYGPFEAALRRRATADLATVFDRNGVCWSRYQTLSEAVRDDARLFRENPMFALCQNPSGMAYPAAGPAVSLLGEARSSPGAAPRLGQHTEEVLASVLGLPAAEIGRLHDTGIVAGPVAP